MMKTRPDWCVSRQRNWNVPIPFFLNKETGALHPRTQELIEEVALRVESKVVQADALGVAADRRVYLRGWAYATDPVYVAEHHDFSSSPAMRAATSLCHNRRSSPRVRAGATFP